MNSYSHRELNGDITRLAILPCLPILRFIPIMGNMTATDKHLIEFAKEYRKQFGEESTAKEIDEAFQRLVDILRITVLGAYKQSLDSRFENDSIQDKR
jgi:hypothetical protein